jgi:hypothetical protein
MEIDITNDVKLSKTRINQSQVGGNYITESMNLDETDLRDVLLWVKKHKPNIFKEVAEGNQE